MASALNLDSPIKLLVVEDHLDLLDVMVETFAASGYDVIGVDSAEAVDELPAHFVADIAVLDLNLPGESGLSLAQRLRHVQPGIGIIMVTALHALGQKLEGYGHGADLYLTKPIAPQELCAAVHALAKRLRQRDDVSANAFLLDTATYVLHTQQGELVLRSHESALLHALALAPNNTLEIFQLLEKLGKPVDANGKIQLEVLISRLRSKLLAHGAPAVCIRAVRAAHDDMQSRGYKLCIPLRIS